MAVTHRVDKGSALTQAEIEANFTTLGLSHNDSYPTPENIYIPDYIYHDGDTDTYFGFPANDQITFRAGNVEAFRIYSSYIQSYVNTVPADYSVTLNGSYTPNLYYYNVHYYTLTGNSTIANDTNTTTAYRPGMFVFKQDATGGRTISWGSYYKGPGGDYGSGIEIGLGANQMTIVPYWADINQRVCLGTPQVFD